MKKFLQPFDVYYRFNGLPAHDVVLAFSARHAVQVLIRNYKDQAAISPDCLTDFETHLIPHLR